MRRDAWLSWLERFVHIEEAAGSSPAASTMAVSRILFILLYIFLLFIPGYTILKNSDNLSALLADPSSITYFFLRLTGLFAFVLVFIQIMLGAFMNFWRRVFGPKILNFHMSQGIITYGLILFHPTFFVLSGALSGLENPVNLLFPRFNDSYELYLSFGKIGFILLTIGVFAAKLRKSNFLQSHWRKFHILNYFGFWFIFVHSFNVGSDVRTVPFIWLYPLMAVLVSISIIYRRIYTPFLKKSSLPVSESKPASQVQ